MYIYICKLYSEYGVELPVSEKSILSTTFGVIIFKERFCLSSYIYRYVIME